MLFRPNPHEISSNPSENLEVVLPQSEQPKEESLPLESTPVLAPAKTICIVNQKGGVGKTTTAINLAASLVHHGKKTLVIDIDPQGNATSGLGVTKSESDATLFDLLAGDANVNDILRPGPVDDLMVAPSNSDLLSAEWQLANEEDGKTRLRVALNEFLDAKNKDARNGAWRPDYVLIDCPPSLGLLTINALLASSAVLIPVQCEYYALEGLVEIIKSTTFLRGQMNPSLSLEGILLTMADKRLNLSQSVEADIRQTYPGYVFQEVIYRSVRLSEAPSHGLPILMYDPASKGARAYLCVAEEIIRNETQSPRPWPVGSVV